MEIISPLLFFSPQRNLKALWEVSDDTSSGAAEWPVLISKMNDDIQEYLLLVGPFRFRTTSANRSQSCQDTVLLAVNVSFLAIPSVDSTNPGQSASTTRNVVQILVYISVAATTCSMIAGFLLRSKQVAAAPPTATTGTSLGIMATLYSLPYALLVWGLVGTVHLLLSLR